MKEFLSRYSGWDIMALPNMIYFLNMSIWILDIRPYLVL